MHNENLKDRVAIVTGASRGIGRSIVLELAREGANICVNYNKNREKADEVVSQINSIGNGFRSHFKARTHRYPRK